MAVCFQADLRVFCELIKLLSLLVNCSSKNEAINGDFDCFSLEILQRAPFLQGNRKLICYEIELVINSSQIASLFLRELSKLDITGGKKYLDIAELLFFYLLSQNCHTS